MVEVMRVLKKGGLFLLSEGFQDGLGRINSLRCKLGLDGIKVVGYNRNMKQAEFERWGSRYFNMIEVRDYGTYFFLSRVFHPLAVSPARPKHNSKLNEAAGKVARHVSIPNLREYSYNLFYALKKK